jgi:hypothetical protein
VLTIQETSLISVSMIATSRPCVHHCCANRIRAAAQKTVVQSRLGKTVWVDACVCPTRIMGPRVAPADEYKRLAFNARHPVEAEEDSQPDSPSSTSRLRPSSPTPTCSLRPVSHRARTQCSKQPHQPYDETRHRKQDHREQASESTLLALESGGLPSRGCRVGMRV